MPTDPQPPRMVELEIIDRYTCAEGSNEVGEGEGGQESAAAGVSHQKITLKVGSTGVEIIAADSSASQEADTENVTRIPLHLVNLDDLSQKSDKHDHVNSEEEDKNSSAAATTVKTIQGHQQILPPIEVGLQLGHPQETALAATATVVVDSVEAEVSEKAPPPPPIESRDVEAQTEDTTTTTPEQAATRIESFSVEVQTDAPTPSPSSAAEEEDTTTAAAAASENVVLEVAPPPRPSLSETSSQTELTYHQLEEEPPTRSDQADSSTVSVVTSSSETQTVRVDQTEFSTQTELQEELTEDQDKQDKPIVEAEVVQPAKEFADSAVQTEESNEADEPFETRIGERPPTLPGSSIDLPDGHLEEPDFNFYRTRTVSPLSLRVQDDVVARVLLEHVGTVFPAPDPRLRSGVNYLDLSRLGDEGETPASDEIWLAVDGSGHSDLDEGAEDKFLTTDDTETYSIITDKLSATHNLLMMDGGQADGPTTLLAPNSANILSDQELADLGDCASFDAEAEATARLQGVLASELVPLTTTVQSTEKNVLGLTNKFGSMETVITSLCNTINTLQNQIVPGQTPKDGDSTDGISIRRVSNGGTAIPPVKKSPSPPPVLGVKKGEVALLDQLVARIEHLSSDVANMDQARSLREDNLLLRKELQTYREREIQMMSRLEILEKRVTDFDYDQPRTRSRRVRSRRSSVASSRGTPELPPIETQRSKSVDPKAEVKTEQKEENMPRLSNEESKSPPPEKEKSDSKLDKIQVKQPLMPSNGGKIKHRSGVPKLRRPSNSSSGASGSESDTNNVKYLSKRQPITPKLNTDELQTEIQIVRSDNSILRNDIQVFRERERQLYSRNMTMQEQLVQALSPRPGDSGTKKSTEDKSEVNINVDFVTDEKTGGPKAVFDAKTKDKKRDSSKDRKRDSSKDRSASEGRGSSSESNESKRRQESKERKGPALKKAPSKENLKKAPSKENLMKKAPSKENIAVPKAKKGSKKSSSSGSESDKQKDSEAGPPIEEEKAVTINTNGVPKTKNNTATKKAASSTAKKPGSNGSSKKGSTKGSSSSSGEDGKEKLLEDEQWKVTISSKHELETHSDDNEKTVTVKPRAVEKAAEVAKEEAKVAKKAKKAAKIEKTKEKKDPIPKPSMYPAARPPRGYVPPPARVNESPGVTRALMGPEAPMLFHGSPMMMDKPLVGPPPRTPRSGRASVDSIDGDREYSMVIKQEPRDSLVDAAPIRILPPTSPRIPRTPAHPPICQVSYDSVYDDPYYTMSYY